MMIGLTLRRALEHSPIHPFVTWANRWFLNIAIMAMKMGPRLGLWEADVTGRLQFPFGPVFFHDISELSMVTVTSETKLKSQFLSV